METQDMQDAAGTGFKAKAACFAYQMKPGFSAKASKRSVLQTEYVTTLTQAMIENGLYSTIYVSPQGVAPAPGGKLAPSTTSSGAPGFNFFSVVSISMSKKKDETKGETDFTNHYSFKSGTASQKMQLSMNSGGPKLVDGQVVTDWDAQIFRHAVGLKVTGMTGSTIDTTTDKVAHTTIFEVDNFVVDEITIRWVTTAEAWASIGGLYAGSMLLIAILFMPTNRVDDEGRAVVCFRFLPDSWKEEYLAPFKETTTAATVAEKIAALEAKVAEMEAKNK
jgi:hypothetical protein